MIVVDYLGESSIPTLNISFIEDNACLKFCFCFFFFGGGGGGGGGCVVHLFKNILASIILFLVFFMCFSVFYLLFSF